MEHYCSFVSQVKHRANLSFKGMSDSLSKRGDSAAVPGSREVISLTPQMLLLTTMHVHTMVAYTSLLYTLF